MPSYPSLLKNLAEQIGDLTFRLQAMKIIRSEYLADSAGELLMVEGKIQD